MKVSVELVLDWLRHLEAGDTIDIAEMRYVDYLVGFLDAAVDRRLDEQDCADAASTTPAGPAASAARL